MQTALSPSIRGTAAGQVAERILRTCVHCGFCNATCPTYQLLGDELDGPRGRIYLIKQMLEGRETTARTLTHLDRCLGCRACETTCPSGVEYDRLAAIGRHLAERGARRWHDRLFRVGLRSVFAHPPVARTVFALARAVARALPASLREQIPSPAAGVDTGAVGVQVSASGGRRVILLAGCVQSAATPRTTAAVQQVLAHFGIEAAPVDGAGCCGALDQHLNAPEAARVLVRRNIDAWWPAIEDGAEAIAVSASGCGAVVRQYGELLGEDPRYAARAARVAALTRDVSELLSEQDMRSLAPGADAKPVAFHPPCSLQHALRLGGRVESLLRAGGVELTSFPDAHLCCGSAGTYSILQPELSEQLLDRKLAAIEASAPAEILTANVGCQLHLQRRAAVPVRHWIELVSERLPGARAAS